MLSQSEFQDELASAHNAVAQIERLLDHQVAFIDEFGRAVTPLIPLLETLVEVGNQHAERLLMLWNRWDADFHHSPF